MLYPLFVLLACVLPRNKKLWVFGNQKHYFDNTRYFFEHVSGLGDGVACYWLASNPAEREQVVALGYSAVLKNSLRGYWLSSRAGFSFTCNGFADVNRLLALNSLVISFWHGTPVKKICLDSQHDLMKLGQHPLAIKTARKLLIFLNRRIDFYYASNEFERSLVTAATAIPVAKSLALGAPRFDIIRAAQRPANLPAGNIILYAPTWREQGFNTADFRLPEAVYDELTRWLAEHDSYFLVKPHPLTPPAELAALGLKPSSRVLYAEDLGLTDISPLYAFSDLLITDLSSSMFDFLVFDRPLLIFMPDVSSYLAGDRGIYNEFRQMYHSSHVLTSWAGLLDALKHQVYPEFPLIQQVGRVPAAQESAMQLIYSDIQGRFF